MDCTVKQSCSKMTETKPEKANVLQYLCSQGAHLELIDLILRRKVQLDKDLKTTTSGNTAFHLACKGLQKVAIEKLLLARVNTSLQNNEGDTGLHILVKSYELNIDKYHIEDILQIVLPFSESSLTKRNHEGLTPKNLIHSQDLFELFREYIPSKACGSSDDELKDIDEFPANQRFSYNPAANKNAERTFFTSEQQNSEVRYDILSGSITGTGN